jgi:hypothetical protein
MSMLFYSDIVLFSFTLKNSDTQWSVHYGLSDESRGCWLRSWTTKKWPLEIKNKQFYFLKRNLCRTAMEKRWIITYALETKSEFNEIKPCKQERDSLLILNFDFFPLGLNGPETHLIWKLSNCFMMIQTEMCISLQNCVICQIS